MNRIDELIEKLCPDGVEFKQLGEVGELIRGNGLQKSDFTETGVGCIHYGQIYTYYGIFTHKTKSFVSPKTAEKLKKVQPGNLIITSTSENIEDVCKTVAWLGDNEIVTGGHAAIFKHNENPKYLAYLTQTEFFFQQKKKYAKGTKVIDVSARDLSKISVPLPPLEIQNEIVNILDLFTELEAKLEVELQAELDARKKQYIFYRNKLLSFERDETRRDETRRDETRRDEEIEWLKLGEICEMKAGKSISAYDISDLRTEANIYPCIGGNGLRGYVKSFSHNGSFPIVGRQGALCGNVNFTEGKFYATEHAVVVKPSKQFNSRFLYYLLGSMNLNQYATGGAQQGLAVSKLEKIQIPVPSLSEQERIVSILDKFDALVNDISIGLPAEIEGRRKQYEYYRNRLLTFKPLNN